MIKFKIRAGDGTGRKSAIASPRGGAYYADMGQPTPPTILTEEQAQELRHKLGRMRHEVNNQLSLMVAAVEMTRLRPELRERMLDTLAQQPAKIQEELARFADELERALGAVHG